MKLRFTQVDAFADRPFAGNSAAVMPLDAWLDDATLQAIALENNLSETAFVLRDASGAADYELRWFTPAVEVAMCGHATLAAGHVLLGETAALDTVRFATRKAGVLTVSRDGEGYALDLPATRMKAGRQDDLLRVFGVGKAEVLVSDNAAEDTVIIVLHDEAAVRAVSPDFPALAHIEAMAIVTAPGDSADIASRVFVSAWGIDEDPVTGSAHAALAPFWAERLGRTEFTAYQASARGGHMRCRLMPASAEAGGDRVVLIGRCVTVIEGIFTL